MSKLTVINAYRLTTNTEDSDVYIHNDDFCCGGDLVECYLKSEADKVIAELKERLDTTEKLLNKALKGISNGNKHMMSLARKKNHADYKRCVAMADMCSEALCYWDNVKYSFFKGEAYCFRKMNHYGKWGHIWLAMAEKFEEAK